MNQIKLPDSANAAPKTPVLPDDLQAASQAVMAALAQKRAQRQAAWAMGEVPKIEALGVPAIQPELPASGRETAVSEMGAVPEIARATSDSAREIPTLTDMVDSPYEAVITPEIRARVEAMRTVIDQFLPELQTNTVPLTADEIVESVANMQAQEADWEKLRISEIRIPRQEVSLWGGLLKMLNQGTTERASHRQFEKGDIYELRIPKFKFFHITRIRQSEKDGLTCAVVQSQIRGMDQTYTIEVLVRLPVQEGGTLEIYRNRPDGIVLINKWKVEQVFLRKNPDERKKKG